MTLLETLIKASEVSPGLLAIFILFILSIDNLNSKEIRTKRDIFKYILSFVLIGISLYFQLEASLKMSFTIQELKVELNCIQQALYKNDIHYNNEKECKKLINVYNKIIQSKF